jgi:four helix bundle protein
MNNIEFNEVFRNRTKPFSLNVMRLYASLQKCDEVRIMGKQLIRSATSVGANFRAVCLSRSLNEKYCIVVEEADESIYWLELLQESHLNIKVSENLMKEANEITKVMSACRIGLGKKIEKYK